VLDDYPGGNIGGVLAENRAAVLVRAAEDVRTRSGPWFLDGGRLDHDYNAWSGAELEAAGDGRIKVSNAHAWTALSSCITTTLSRYLSLPDELNYLLSLLTSDVSISCIPWRQVPMSQTSAVYRNRFAHVFANLNLDPNLYLLSYADQV